MPEPWKRAIGSFIQKLVCWTVLKDQNELASKNIVTWSETYNFIPNRSPKSALCMLLTLGEDLRPDQLTEIVATASPLS